MVLHLKSQLAVRKHRNLPWQNTFDVVFNGVVIATVNGGDGPGVRIMTKHDAEIRAEKDPLTGLSVVDITIDPTS